MERKLLKSAFFGYSKTSVCKYIAAVNEEFSQKLLELSEEHKREKTEWMEKTKALENELNEYKKVHQDVTTALLEAQQHASALKQKAEAEDSRFRAEADRKHQLETERLTAYVTAINELRDMLSAFSAQTDEKLLAYLHQGTSILKEFEETTVCEEE